MNDTDTKPAAKPRANPLEEGAMRVRVLTFRANAPMPQGLEEQNVMRMVADMPRPDKPRYRIMYLPRIDKYLVRAYKPDSRAIANEPTSAPTHTFMIPGDWAIAEFAEP
jgi:hypothetical protein